mmetsp:Transcript_13899/g.29954  ORF Transcript_13899/g.29954 Transcript_13899/m.29954 type:complete len:211 (+) Transcript_13899:185-817(+)
MKGFNIIILSILNHSTSVYALASHQLNVQQQNGAQPSRRRLLQTGVAFLLTTSTTPTPPANAIESCRSNSRNCIRTTWTAPSSAKSKADVVKTIREVLNSYPQEGQASVDCNGWSMVDDSLDTDVGTAFLEYKSCVGPAAISINLGQPFTDDVKLELKDDGGNNIRVEVLSKSLMGGSDFNVNKKRLQYLGDGLEKLGWGVPVVKYPYEG